jgi:hypothetical protein
VDFVVRHIGREFDAGDDFEVRAAGGVDRRVDARGRIVIGDRERVQPAFNRERDELRGREFAVGRVRVRVQIDAARRAV